MKSTRNYMGAEGLVLASYLLAVSLIPNFMAHQSGFVKYYNQAVSRNADLNRNGNISVSEELKFKQTLIKEVTELQKQGKGLEDIVNWLKSR